MIIIALVMIMAMTINNDNIRTAQLNALKLSKEGSSEGGRRRRSTRGSP